jgi:hypothetical protein
MDAPIVARTCRSAFALVFAAIVLAGCGLFDSDDPVPLPDTVMMTFRIEATEVPNGGWGYWYVYERVLYRINAGDRFGPFGVRADCGTHAGIDARLTEAASADDRLTLVMEVVEAGSEEPSVSRQEFAGPGLHQAAVLVTCP